MNTDGLPIGIFVHGLGSGANSESFKSVYRHLPMFDWRAIEVNENPEESIAIINASIDKLHPQVLLGTSLGGLYLMYANVYEAIRVLHNPACNISSIIREKIGFGDKEYFCPRQDGIQQYVLDEDVCRRFEDYVQTHVPTRGKQDFALFCIYDELIGPEGILQNQAICYNNGYVIMIEKKSGHKLDGRALKLIRQRVFV